MGDDKGIRVIWKTNGAHKKEACSCRQNLIETLHGGILPARLLCFGIAGMRP